MRQLYVWVALLFGMTVSAQGCNCGKSTLTRPPGVCDKTTKCAANDEYRKGVCLTARCDNTKTNPNADCCPGQLCRFDGSCIDQLQNCLQDVDCMGGQTCQLRADVETDKNICSFPIPTSAGVCPDGYVVFDKRCIRDLPCGGACPDTQICNIETNACEITPDIPTDDTTCAQSCATGSIKAYADPDSMIYHQCCAVGCVCDVLPPLQVGQYGGRASAALSQTEIVVASYNVTYGDLMVSHHSKVDGTMTLLEFVDGVPATGTLAGDPKGYRNGIKDPGPNVGDYSSIVVGADGHIRVTYYDIDNQDLKYAEKTDNGWAIHTVDSAGAVGKYSFLEIMNGGARLRVTYLVEAGPLVGQAAGDNTLHTMLRYIESDSQSPTSAASWSRPIDIDAQLVKPIPCGGTCQSAELCVVVSGAEKCAAAASTCNGTAPTGQVCATPDGTTSTGFYVEHPIPSIVELPPAIGLFSSVVEKGTQLYASYYDNYTDKGTDPLNPQIGRLRGVRFALQPSGSVDTTVAPSLFTLDQGMVCNSGDNHDVGRFTSIAVNPSGAIGIAYQDVGSDSGDRNAGILRYFSASDFENADPINDCLADGGAQSTSGHITVVDNGIDIAASTVDVVGGNASLIFDRAGKAQIAYQDQTAISLELATETAENTEKFASNLISDPNAKSVGFSSKLVTDGTNTWVMHVHIGFDANNNANDAIIVAPLTLP